MFSFQSPEPEQTQGPRGRAPGPPALLERHPVPADRAPERGPHRPPAQQALHPFVHFQPE